MKIKIIITLFIIATIGWYVIGLIGNPFIFIISSVLLALFFMSLVYFLTAVLVMKLIPSNKKKFYEIHKMQLRIIILFCFVFFSFGCWASNKYLLPEMFHLISLFGYLGILIFSIFLGLALIKRSHKRILFTGTVIFIFFIALVTAFSKISFKQLERSSIDALKTLPYLKWIPAGNTIQKLGVTKYDQRKSFKGINIYYSSIYSTAYLMDMSGNILHTWSAKVDKDDYWSHIEMCENGDLFCLVRDKYFIWLDWNSNVKKIKKIRSHHDLAIAENKDIYFLIRKDDLVFYKGLPVPILNDYIVVLSPKGEIKKEMSLYKILKKEVPSGRFICINFFWIPKPSSLIRIIKQRNKSEFIFNQGPPFDILHTNTIEIIGKDIDSLCKKGDLLISLCFLDLIGILDIEREKIIWKWGPGHLDRQHHPTLLENENILIFDNGTNRKYSRIIELDPLTKKIVWEYTSKPLRQFFSPTRGGNQRLPNGNTLITESDRGRVFEITKNGEIVWEFYNPVIDKTTKKREEITRMMRITEPEKYSLAQVGWSE